MIELKYCHFKIFFFQIDKGMPTKRPVADVFQIYVNYVHGYVFFNNYNGIGYYCQSPQLGFRFLSSLSCLIIVSLVFDLG